MKILWALGKIPLGGRLPKFLLIMRLTLFLIICSSLGASAGGYAQGKISLTLKDAPLEVALNDVLKQSNGYDFVGSPELLKKGKPVTLNVKEVTLEQALDECFKGQPLTYSIKEKIIVVKPVLSNEKKEIFQNEPPMGIHGRIVDSVGTPLEGASVQVRGTKIIVATDRKGNFELPNVGQGAILDITYTGFQPKEIRLVAGQPDLRIMLRISTSPLDEIQVVAYGTTTQRFSVGDVSSVSGEEIARQPVSNPLLALEGRVPGLFITQNTGVSGGGVTVRIQGQNSFLNGNDPLYIVDGVPITSELPSPIGGNILGSSGGKIGGALIGVGSPLSYLNPSDIESVEVLKDADATAIYGSRAANGAILITTKKGKVGAMKVDINVQQGMGQVTRTASMLSRRQYLDMRYEALKNDGLTPQPTDYDLTFWDSTRSTNWEKTLIGGTAQYTNINTSLSGGTAYLQYLIGATYHRETTVFPGDFADQKGTVHFSINSSSSNQRFRIQMTGSYTVDDNKLPATDLTFQAFAIEPDAPSLYNPNGTLNWAPNAAGSSTWSNPLALLYTKYNSSTNYLISNTILSYKILPGLEVKSSFGYTIMQGNGFQGNSPLLSIAPELRATTTRDAQYSNLNNNTWITEPQVTYNKIIGLGKFDLLVGSTIQQTNSKSENEEGQGYNSDAAMADLNSAATLLPGGSSVTQYKYDALFGRANYIQNGKYILSMTGRRDGSSRFGPENEFHDFWSIGGGWIFSQESFLKHNPMLSFGKLRASYGTTGSDQIGDYSYLNLYYPAIFPVSYQNVSTLTAAGLNNPYLQWETTRKLQAGADLGFLKDRILIHLTYSRNRSSNELLGTPLPSITGASTITTNLAATIQNTTKELGATIYIFKTAKFTWTSSINLTLPANKVIAFPGLDSSGYSYYYKIGEPVTVNRVVHSNGVDPNTGQYEYTDSHGSATSDPSFPSDFNRWITTLPKFYGGVQNSLSYKGFQLDFLFQFVKQIGLVNNTYNAWGMFPGQFYAGSSNQSTAVLNHWTKPGDKAAVAPYTTSPPSGYYNIGASDYVYKDASYIRLKNLSISWQVPASWTRRSGMTNARFYVQGQNLLTITKYIGLDPESQSYSSIPPLRMLTAGLQIGF